MDDTGSIPRKDPSEADKDRLIEELRAAVRARDEFVAIAAHELRNPMTPILMQVGLLLAAARDPERCRAEVMVSRVEVLEHAVQEFLRRSTILLDVSRITTGNLHLEPRDVDATQIVRGVMGRVKVAAEIRRCELEADLQENVVGLWDPLAVEQITENLLSNAIKFGADKPVSVKLRSDGHIAELIVQDRGVGISDQDHARIFQRFEQAVSQREHGGFGIGLWLANQMVLAMGGMIDVASSSGQGSTFTVRLPLTIKGTGA